MPSDDSTQTPVRWGFLAAGLMARAFAADLVKSSGGVAHAVGARSLSRAQEFAADFGAAEAYGSYDELVADPSVDVVYVSSPHTLHHEHARLALEAGKPVVVEKPFAMTEAEAADLVSLAASKGLFLMEAMWTRCNPLTIELARRISAGEFGEIRTFEGNLGPVGLPAGHRALDGALGGGVLLEGLCYPLAMIEQLAPELGAPGVVHAVSARRADGADEATSILLGWPSGASAVMTSAYIEGITGIRPGRAAISGTGGWAEFPEQFHTPSKLVTATTPEGPVVTRLTDNREYGYEIDEVHRCLRAGLLESPLVPLASTLRVARTIDRVVAAAAASASVS